MTTGNGISISGLDDCLRWMDQMPENCVKAAQTALRDASKEVTKTIRARTPKRWRRLVKYKVKKLSTGQLNAALGLWNGHQQQGHQNKGNAIDDWFKAYWANYGTLTHRDPNHHFIKPVKPSGTAAAKRRRNNIGQSAQLFFEDAIAGYEDRFVKTFSDSLAKQESTFYAR